MHQNKRLCHGLLVFLHKVRINTRHMVTLPETVLGSRGTADNFLLSSRTCRCFFNNFSYCCPNKMEVDLDKCYEVVYDLAKKAGDIIRDGITSKKNIETKSGAIDLVTEYDKQVEKVLISSLQASFPDHKFIGEESVAEGIAYELTDLPTWIIDPIDGTMNFVHGYPNTCTSIALLVNCQAEIAIVYNPVLEQMFTARRGKGAFFNGKKIKTSSVKELQNALILLEVGTSREPDKVKAVFENLKTFVPLAHGVRAGGSAALNMAMVALGAADAYLEFGIHAWDMAAGDLIVREAGGAVIDPAGGPFDVMSRRVLCSSSKELAIEMVPHITQLYPPRD